MKQNLQKISRECIEQSFREKGAAERILSPLGLSIKRTPPRGFSNNETPLDSATEIKMFVAIDFLNYWMSKSNNPCICKRLMELKLALRNRIVCANIGLIYRSMQITPIKSDTDTFLSAGHIALIDAAEKYNPHLGIRFSTYATVSILRRFNRDCRRRGLNIQDETDPTDLADVYANHDDAEECRIQVEQLTRLLDVNSGVLSKDDIDILRLRFNLDGDQDHRMTLQEIASRYDRSKERIRQLQKEAIRKLQKAFGANDPA